MANKEASYAHARLGTKPAARLRSEGLLDLDLARGTRLVDKRVADRLHGGDADAARDEQHTLVLVAIDVHLRLSVWPFEQHLHLPPDQPGGMGQVVQLAGPVAQHADVNGHLRRGRAV
eukprot:641493-Prorocentrum_minimum.AAC.3